LISRQTKVAHGATDANITMYPNWNERSGGGEV